MNDQMPPAYPISHRAELLGRVMAALRSGESCSLVGTSGVGKSNLAQFLCHADVQRHYWGDEPIWVVPIDSNGMVFGAHPAEYVALELMIHRVAMEADARGLPAESAAWIAELHAQLTARPDTLLAMRYLERICAALCRRHGVRLVFLFDQFEDLWRQLDSRLFLNLRYLRDQLKYRLAYLVFTRGRLTGLREDLPAVESFYELFTSHTFGITMVGERDARFSLERLARRSGRQLEEADAQRIMRLGGGHFGLQRALFWLLTGPEAPPEAGLGDHPAIVDESRKIWLDLDREAQRAARALALGTPPRLIDPAALESLRLTGLAVDDPPRLFSPLFAAFALRHTQEEAGVVVDARQRLVWLDGQPLSHNLAPLEFTMLAYLARHAGVVCRREAIIEELYGERGGGPNDERLDTIVRRLRETLGEEARNPRYLITHRGVGFQLTRGQLQE